jgi:hypothetical protein
MFFTIEILDRLIVEKTVSVNRTCDLVLQFKRYKEVEIYIDALRPDHSWRAAILYVAV